MLGERGIFEGFLGCCGGGVGSVVWGVLEVFWECFGGVEYFWVGVC